MDSSLFLDPMKMIEDEQLCERDMQYMRSCYPISAKKMVSALCELCDKMEYEGSSMFAQFPDRETIGRMVDTIYEQSQKTGLPSAMVKQQEIRGQEGMMSRKAIELAQKELLQIMLCDEIHRRRMRYRRRCNMFLE